MNEITKSNLQAIIDGIALRDGPLGEVLAHLAERVAKVEADKAPPKLAPVGSNR